MKKERRTRKGTAWWLAGLMLLTLLTGCAKKSPLPQETDTKTQTPEGMMAITTEFGNLYYPDQWREFVSVDEQSSENATTLSFKAKIGDAVYPLFEVEIGEGAETSNAIGTLTDDKGIGRNVYASMEDLPDTSQLSEEELDRLYAMREGLNDLIENLK